MPRTLPATVIAATAALVCAGPVHAQNLQNRVQLQAFQVKVIDSLTGKTGQLPITIFVDTPNGRAAQTVCSVGPRVRDALLTHLRKQTYKLDAQNKLDTSSIAAGSRPVIEKAVGKQYVTGVLASMELPKVKPAAAAMFARLGCIGVADAGDDDGKKSKSKAKAKH